MSKSRFKVPHTLVLLFGMIVAAQLLTYVLPQGKFERETKDGHEYVVAGTYQRVEERVVLKPWACLTAVPRGFEKAQDIIFFVFIIGGAFGVFRRTGAADALIGWLLRSLGDRPKLLIGAGIFVFALGSSAIGMAEEYIPFVPLLLALCIGLGFDAVTAIGVLCVGYGTGYGVAAINPFTVLIAQKIAGLEPASGLGFRLAISLPFLAIGFHHVWSYARRVKADPASSLVADIETTVPEIQKDTPMTNRRLLILVVVAAAIAGIVAGIELFKWYLLEMGAIFLGLTVVLAIVGRLGVDETARTFAAGAGELTMTALLIGFARGIKVVLDDGLIVDTLINGVAAPLEAAGPSVAAVGMYALQCACNLFIPSGSGQAYVTMPIMAPLSDVVGVPRQTAVLAYQFGDGFTNIIVPTNGVLVGILAMAGIPYERWLRFILPFILKMLVAGAIVLVIAVAIGY